jgi:hypothetical protein
MNSDTYAIVHWVTDRQTVMNEIEKQVDKLLEGRTAGTFIVDVHGPYGSRNEDVKELPV